MPQPSRSEHRQGLIDRLAHELAAPGAGPQPLIIERHIRGTNSRHIWVAWDQWDDYSDEERAETILGAYEKFEGISLTDNISVALGIKASEAAIFGVVPYLVEPQDAQDQKRPEYGEILAQEVRHTILGEKAKELRSLSEDEANRGIERLKQLNPEIGWVVRQDGDDEED